MQKTYTKLPKSEVNGWVMSLNVYEFSDISSTESTCVISGVWGYFLIHRSPITHTHFVQTAEPSRVAVRQPSPQRTGLAVISKYTQHSNPTAMQPVRGQCAFSFAGNWLQKKRVCCTESTTHKFDASKVHSLSFGMHFLLVPFQCPM